MSRLENISPDYISAHLVNLFGVNLEFHAKRHPISKISLAHYIMSLPEDALPHVKCSTCNGYLSFFPIYFNLNSLQPMCGRCSELLEVTENCTRNTTYESVAQFLRFPCIYDSRGCIEHLTPKDVPKHEETCPYKTICCALDCIWQGTAAELVNHVQEMHPTALIRNAEFEIATLNSYQSCGFLIHNGEIFALKRRFNETDNVLQCSLFCYRVMQNSTKYFYEMVVFNGSKNLSVKFPMKSADNFLEENVTEVDVESVKTKLNDPSILMAYIKVFTPEEKKEANCVIEPRKPNPKVNIPMLGELECPVCFEYIIPPIYQCIAGHSMCGDCKSRVTICPICKGSIKSTQNVTLEKMASYLTYPCRNFEHGCEFTAKPDQMRQHLAQCPVQPHQCILNDYEGCNWRGLFQEFSSHVTDCHRQYVLETDHISVMLNDNYLRGQHWQCYIKKFGNRMFKIHYHYRDRCFFWDVQLIGPKEEAQNYKFEIDINDNDNRRIFVRSLCSPLKDKGKIFKQKCEPYVFVDLSQVNSFIKDRLSYVVRITNASIL